MYMERYKARMTSFSGSRDDIEERFNKEVQQGWRFAADAPSLSDKNAGSVDCKCTSGGVSLIEIVFGAVVDKKRSVHVVFLDMRVLRYLCGIQKVGHRDRRR